LVTQLGGEPTPGIGWALGEERLVGLMQVQGIVATDTATDVCMVVVGSQAEAAALKLAEQLREALPSLRLETLCGGGSFKSQLKRADKSGARWAIILGDSETEKQVVGLKSLRVEAPQTEVTWDALAEALQAKL
jgi:histidyl-tRNA synthetase